MLKLISSLFRKMRFIFLNISQKVKSSLPRTFRPLVAELLPGKGQGSPINESERCLRQLLSEDIKINKTVILQHLDELSKAGFIHESLEKYKTVISQELEHKLKGKTIWEHKLSGKCLSINIFCFVALRLTKPEVVVETGCATGWISTLLLYALYLNKKGHLYSIDIPPEAGKFSMNWTLPEELSPGFLIPEVLRNRWTLITGDARQYLMPLLQEQKDIGVFYHDSDHTYHHMMWEYTSVWPHLKPGGLLISDDISINTAFGDFAKGVGKLPVIHSSNPNFGALSKP